jgi:ABC-type tungstate transport system substrate-binding protein
LGSLSYITDGFTAALQLLISGDVETFNAVWNTIATSSLSMLASLCIGVPLGFAWGILSSGPSAPCAPWWMPFWPFPPWP